MTRATQASNTVRWTRRQFLGLLGGTLAGALLPGWARASQPEPGRVTIGGLAVWDWRDKLPVRHTRPLGGDLSLLTWDPERKYWRYRLRNRPITTAVVHHSVSSANYTLLQFVSIHIEEDERDPYPECAYHFIIDKAGAIHYCVDMSRRTWHSSTQTNDSAVGMCLLGTFMGDAMPTAAQLASGRRLLTALRREMPFLHFSPHSGMPGADTWCPGDTWPRWRDRILPLPEENKPQPRNPEFYSPTGLVARG